MTTFILRVAGDRGGDIYGTVCHAATGEVRPFADVQQFLALILEWSAVAGIRADTDHWRTLTDAPAASANRQDLEGYGRHPSPSL
jgi:hypothetical protein